MFYGVEIMETNFLLLDNTQNVLALLQKGYTFIETDASTEGSLPLIVGIPHMAQPAGREAQLLSQFLVSSPQVAYGVDTRYFES